MARSRDKAAQENEYTTNVGEPGPAQPREVKALTKRGKLQILEPVAGENGEVRLTRSRSRTPAASTPAVNVKAEASEPEDKAAEQPASRPQRRRSTLGMPAETGQGLTDQAASGLAKALNRNTKRKSNKKSEQPGGKRAKLPLEDPDDGAAEEETQAVGPVSKKGKSDKGKEIRIELPALDAAKAAPKRRKTTGVTPANIADACEVEPGSEEDDEWEPDWKSAEEKDDGSEISEVSEDDDSLVDVPLIDRQQPKPAPGGKTKAVPKKKAAKKPAKAPKGKKRKQAEEEEATADSDDDIWRVYGSDMEEDLNAPLKVLKPMEAPSELLMELLPYQKEFLGWAVQQEKGDIKGGILADEMGMGKTIQAISVIVTHRTDDDSKLPSLVPKVAVEEVERSKDTSRPKLRLQNAAAAPKKDAKEQAAGSDENEEWEDIEGVSGRPDLTRGVSTTIHKEDTVVPDLIAEDAAPAQLDLAPSLKGPDAVIPLKESPQSVRPAMMAVGESCCGTGEQAASAPAGVFSRATLVICPLVAIIQWRQEIARFVEPGTLKVVIFHGGKRATSKEELEDADVVLTTYSTAEGDFRRHNQPNKATCTYCQKKYYPDRLKVHLRFFCGPNAKKSEALAKQQKKRPRDGKTAKNDAFDEEPEEDDAGGEGPSNKSGSSKKRSAKGKAAASKASKGKGAKGKSPAKGKSKAAGTKSKSKPAKRQKKGGDTDYSGDSGSEEDFEAEESSTDSDEAGPSRGRVRPKRVRNGAGWEEKAMAEALEMIAASEKRGSKAADTGKSLLHEVRWRRIILDEAHSIKDRRSSTARSIFAMDSKYKWALSGTPLQNRVSELYSLVRFLRIFPYAYYFCNQGHSKTSKKSGKGPPCTCKSLDYSFRTNWRQCDHCKHSPLHHYCYWNKWVANPIKNYGYIGKGRAAMRLLKSEILDKILLRRTKVQCADVLALPPRTVVLRKDRFDEREEDFYEALYTQSQAQFETYVETSTVLNNYAHVFSLLVRLRQAVNHPYLVVHSSTAPGAEAGPSRGPEGACNICHDPLEDGIAASCGHAFCRVCITDFMESATAAAKCTACEKPLTIDLVNAPQVTSSRVAGSKKDSIINRVSLANFQSSTKIEALREELERMQQRDPSGKAIVFSQFTSMLDLIFFRLQEVGIKCVRLEGSMTIDQRNRKIDAFTTDASVKVFLMSLKAGGVALNLTAASHVMLMDPWWNPAVEQQAQDRIHRLGQFKPIHVTRFVIGGTIEERILKLQDKKQLVFEGTVGRDSEALGRLTEDDLRFLFG